jgi:hypothetical protein
MNNQQVVLFVMDEYYKAIAKHPIWPDDIIHQSAIVAEAAGEVVKAVNDYHWHDGDIESVKTELAHTGAMCIRMLANLDAAIARKHERNKVNGL